MHLRELLTASRLFCKYELRATYYNAYIQDKNWAAWELGEVPAEEVKRLFLFLKQWGMQFLPVGTEAITGFQKSYSNVHKLLKGIGDVRLETIDLCEQTGEGLSNIKVIAEIFDSMAYCFGNNKRESTAASKILHTVRPSLFVMWDSDICWYGYQLLGGGYPYANYFLPRMQKEALLAINEYAQEKQCSQTEATEGITRLAKALFFTKLVDEWNYCRFNRKMRRRIEDGEGKSLDRVLTESAE